MNISDLKISSKYTRDDLKEIFQNNSFMRGMNKCNKTNCLVLTSDQNVGRIYGDTFKDDYVIYTGEGLEGDQKLIRNNKTLAKSNENHLPVHLFVRLIDDNGLYTYYGLVRLAGEIYTEIENDKQNKPRKVLKFPLKRISQLQFDEEAFNTDEAEFEDLNSIRKTYNVVGAAIMMDDRVLIAQRKDKELNGKWEFPGGKIEIGETPEEALQREIKEELGIDVSVHERIDSSYCEYKNYNVNLTVFKCTKIDDKDIKDTEHNQLKWIDANKILEEDMADADIPIAESLVESLPLSINGDPLQYDYFESKPIEENDKQLRRAVQDYEKSQKAKQKAGDSAESAVVRYEKDNLNNIGRPDLADQVKQVSKFSSDYGYDISSYEIIDGRGVETHIEVKSAKLSDNYIEFFISENELKKFKTDPAYKIYCLFRMGKEYKLHIVNKNDFFASNYLIPLTYKVRIRIHE